MKFNENDKNEIFHKNIIKDKNYNKNENSNNFVNNNNNKINSIDEKDKNIISFNSSIFRSENYQTNEQLNQNIKLPKKIENKTSIPAENMLKKSNEKIDSMNNTKNPSQILLKVQKRIAPEI